MLILFEHINTMDEQLGNLFPNNININQTMCLSLPKRETCILFGVIFASFKQKTNVLLLLLFKVLFSFISSKFRVKTLMLGLNVVVKNERTDCRRDESCTHGHVIEQTRARVSNYIDLSFICLFVSHFPHIFSEQNESE